MTVGCETPIFGAKAGVVVASGGPLWPCTYPGYGVVIDHGGGIQTWYWHITTQIIVQPGAGGGHWPSDRLRPHHRSVPTGCHLHFATNINGIWENPRFPAAIAD